MFRLFPDPNPQRASDCFKTFFTCLLILFGMAVSYQTVVVMAMLPRPDHWFVAIAMSAFALVCMVTVWLLAHSPIRRVSFTDF